MATCPTQEIELCQFQSNQISLVLSLRTFLLDGIIPQLHQEVILMDTLQ